jgi:glycine hydroxymethyltransferase
MKEAEMVLIAGWMDEALRKKDDGGALERIKQEVEALCARFPLYAHLAESIPGDM